jgi:NurA-like 5'-3' nuclease
MSYYLNKGTEKENEFDNLSKEIESKITELNEEFLTKDLEDMQVLDAINIFKKKNFYIRMLKCYLMKIKLLKKDVFENTELIDEMCYFIFFPEFKIV